jgi:NitT/TauT family transport system ATP-binding protein
MSILKVDINKKTYGSGVHTIDKLQFSAQDGEFVAIVGPSGTGKTTLLNIIAGIDTDVDGSVSFNELPPSLARLGFMFQEARLMPWLTVNENIKLVVQEGDDEVLSRVDEMLARVGLDDFNDAFPSQLSGGMKRRAALVRAFINHPQLLLMDEPFQSLDKPTANSLRQLLLVLWEETTYFSPLHSGQAMHKSPDQAQN